MNYFSFKNNCEKVFNNPDDILPIASERFNTFHSINQYVSENSDVFANTINSTKFEMSNYSTRDVSDSSKEIDAIRNDLEKIKSFNFSFSFFLDTSFISNYKHIFERIANSMEMYIAAVKNESVSDALNAYKDFSEMIKESNEHINYCKGINTDSNSDYSIIECIDNLLFPYVTTKGKAQYNIPFNDPDPSRCIYDIIFDMKSIVCEILFVKGDVVSEFFRYVHESKDKNIDLYNIGLNIFTIFDITFNTILENLEDINEIISCFYALLIDSNDKDINESNVTSLIPERLLHKIDNVPEDYEYSQSEIESIEANSMIDPDRSTNSIALDKVDSTYKNKWIKIQKTVNDIFKVKVGKLKLKIASAFFKKWYGRIPTMMSRYGDETTIPENRMKGDPVEILTNSGIEYLRTLSKETDEIFNTIINCCKRIASAGNLTSKVGVAKDFCKQYPIEGGIDEDPKTIARQIANEATFRIAKAIMQNNGVYGYSVNGIVENGKFPTCNHIVVSLFIDNPHEKPEEISVNSIFNSPESILIFAHPEKLNTVETVYNKSMSQILSTFDHRACSTTIKNMDKNYKMFAANLTKQANIGAGMTPNEENGNGEDIKHAKKVAKALEDGFTDALDIVIDQKRRCIQCIGVMYDMMNRIQKLAKRCIASMHDTEVTKSDTKFNSGINKSGLNRSVKSANKANANNRAYLERINKS